MSIKYFDKKGKTKQKKVSFGFEGIDKPVNHHILNTYIYVYLSNQRKAKAKVKDRSEVSGGGKKPWRQKGTGRARFGSIRVPIWRGGGITFGPTGNENYKKNLPKKVRKVAFVDSLRHSVEEGKVSIVESYDFSKTKDAQSFFDASGLNQRSILLVHDNDKKVVANVKNLKYVKPVNLGELNTYDVLMAHTVLMDDKVLENLKSRLEVKA